MKKYDVIGHQYINRGNGAQCYVESVSDMSDLVHYRLYNDLLYIKSAPYKQFRANWKNNGLHKPLVGMLYRRREPNNSPHNIIVCVTGVDDTYSSLLVDYFDLANGLNNNMSLLAFNTYFVLDIETALKNDMAQKKSA